MKRLLLALAFVSLAASVSAQTVPLSPWIVGAPVVVFSGSASQVLAVDGTVAAPPIAFASQPGLGFYKSASSTISLANDGVSGGIPFSWSLGVYRLGSAGTVAWSSTTAATGTSDTALTRNAAGALAVSNASTIGTVFKVDALPVASACGAGSPAVVAGSTPVAGSVTVGTGGPITCTITFGGTAFPTAPFCGGAVATTTAANARAMGYSTTTTVLTIVPAAAWADGSVVTWVCPGAK